MAWGVATGDAMFIAPYSLSGSTLEEHAAYRLSDHITEDKATINDDGENDDDELTSDTTAVDIASRCALLAARCENDALRPLYNEYADQLPPHIALYCRLAFARGDGRLQDVVLCIDSLEHQCADLFDLRGLLALSDVRCEALRAMGDYKALKRYCRDRLDWAYRRGIKASRQRNLLMYQDLAGRFADQPSPSVTWGSKRINVPLHADWPRLLPVTMWGSEAAENLPFLYAPDQPVTLISEADAAEAGIVAIGEPVKLRTSSEIVSVTPARVDSMVIGDLTLRDVMVFIVNDESMIPPYNRVLGGDILHHMPYRATSAQCLVASANPLELSPRFVPSSDSNTALPPRRVGDYLAAADLFGLLRGEPSLFFTASDDERAAMENALNQALTPPAPDDLPAGWAETVGREPSPASTPHTLMATAAGLAYETLDPETATFRTVYLATVKPIQGHAIDLPNMIIYVP